MRCRALLAALCTTLMHPGLLHASLVIGDPFVTLVGDGKPAATLVLPADAGPIWGDIESLLMEPAQRWGGVVPRVVRLAADAPLPGGDLILIGTPATSSTISRLSRETASEISRLPFIDQEGFAIESRREDGSKRLVIAGPSPRGAYNGAILCRDFLLDAGSGPAGQADVFVREANVLRSPRMKMRGTYCLSIYGRAMQYTADDWKKIVDRHAEDGMNLLCFWLSGHHPSKKYPQLYDVDGAKGTKLTVDGVTELIRYCHDRGIKFYISGGVFAWTASHYLGQDHPEIHAEKVSGLCPSKPYARQANREHFLEMYKTWPEADGFMLEVRDEHGECQCADCRQPVDEFGSRAYGKAEITWLQELARDAWELKPELEFLWLIGYAEHASDVYYYDQIRHMTDPRFAWLDTRVGLDGNGKWTLPGPAGAKRPFAFFSPRIVHWDPFYRHRIEHLIHWAGRIADEGLYGYVPAFEPGFGAGSYYGNEIPLPVNIMPFCLTGLTYRELTWEPATTLAELKKRIHRRYFSPQTADRFAEDMLYLHQFCMDHWVELTQYGNPRFGYVGEELGRVRIGDEIKRVTSMENEAERRKAAEPLLKTCRSLAVIAEELERMDQIESAMQAAAANATPKDRDGFALIQRMIDDTRRIYRDAVPDASELTAGITALGG